MIEAYIKMFKNFTDFSGRSRRRDFWLAMLFSFIIFQLLLLIGLYAPSMMFVSLFYMTVSLIPCIALTVRRLHDTNKTGWWLLFYFFVPIIGLIVFIVFTAIDSGPDNQYGPNPKNITTETI